MNGRQQYVVTVWRDGVEPYWATTAYDPQHHVSEASGHLVLQYTDTESGAKGMLFVTATDTLIVCPAEVEEIEVSH